MLTGMRTRYALRLPLVWWMGVVGLATVTALVVASIVGAATKARDAYGRTVEVAVATRAVPAGEVLAAADVELRDWPEGLVPAGALRSRPVGRAARVALVEGEVVLASRLAPRGITGSAAALPDGWRGVAVPTSRAPVPPLTAGDLVDVLVTLAPGSGEPGTGATDDDAAQPPTVVVASAAVVIEVTADAVTVAVREDEAPRVAYGVSAGAVTLALVGS